MAMTLEDMQSEVRDNIKRTSSALADSRLTRFINWAQERIAGAHTFEEMKLTYQASTIKNYRRYTFPTRMKDLVSVKLLNGSSSRKLTYVHPTHFDAQVPYPENESSGTPSCYVDYGIYFELFRLPDSAYTMETRCSIYPADLSVSTDESDLVRKDALICSMATAFGFMTLKELSDADYWGGVVGKELLGEALESDHSGEDWAPIARGFDAQAATSGTQTTDYTNPWMGR